MTPEEKRAVWMLRYALYEVLDTVKHDARLSWEARIIESALRRSEKIFGKWDEV